MKKFVDFYQFRQVELGLRLESKIFEPNDFLTLSFSTVVQKISTGLRMRRFRPEWPQTSQDYLLFHIVCNN